MLWTNRLSELTREALWRVLRFDSPADAVLSQFFRENPKLGHGDRGHIAETVYAIVRRKRSLEVAIGDKVNPHRMLMAALVCLHGKNMREIETILDRTEIEWLGGVRAKFLQIANEQSPAVIADLPDWLYERWVAAYGESETKAMAKALNRPAALDLRVNSLKAERDPVLARLNKDGMEAEATPFSPLGIRLQSKPVLSRHPLFQDGSIEVQDEGSQLLGLLLAPKRGEMVADFCAGAGGKTLLLGAMMRSTGRLYAFDVAEKRLAKLKPRLIRSGLSNVHPVRIDHERDSRIKRLAGKMDRVLVDAPCSGLGTLRRNPDLKWRQTPEAVLRLVETQAAILAAASTLLKPGGRLVYATCSLLPEENEQVVNAFLATHPDFVALDARQELARQGVNIPLLDGAAADPYLHLLPHRHATDGFFAAALERRPAKPAAVAEVAEVAAPAEEPTSND
jgi:16S rRNA (cytosine967-C5)-methyltransferase